MTVHENRSWSFHACVICDRALRTPESRQSGIGPECQRKTTVDLDGKTPDEVREDALERDRQRFRAEVLDLGFKIGE